MVSPSRLATLSTVSSGKERSCVMGMVFVTITSCDLALTKGHQHVRTERSCVMGVVFVTITSCDAASDCSDLPGAAPDAL